ncbi:transcription initiation protein SPT3 homolog [Coccinella septempunctata]|uniref:transcription initiation protein SPT3 homolog n=1 Tax=Coccinella septempunctata TaxID=41139 RepID=UPI001D075E8F|nr:transcription initiation protein SPT3 homolog [Coccinella septempunctata]
MEQQKPKVTFTNEISRMMFGFGDSCSPNPETVQLVENITLDQLRTIVREALKYSADGKTLKGEELIFLMRHDKYKMRRFVKYLHNKVLKNIQTSNLAEIDLDVKPKGYLMEFIQKIDETGEFTDLTEMDEVKHQRDLRADRISQALDEEQYLEFCKARTTSFCSKHITMRNLERLKNWIDSDPNSQIVFRLEALEVLAYLAYQTVAEIVDYALLVRMDANGGHDPLKHIAGSYYSATMFSYAHKFGASNFDHSRVYSGQAAITVNEIKEVMRRVRSPQAGVLNFGGKPPETRYCFAL